MKPPTSSALVPATIADCQALAHVLVAAGMVDDREYEQAADRVRRLGGGTIASTLEANLFAKIYAGASRGLDAVTSVRLFAIFNGTIRAVREGPLALVQASGELEEIDERIIVFADLQALAFISVESPAAPRRVPESAIQAARLRWCGENPDWGKLRALDAVATDRASLIEQTDRPDGTGYKAAVCCVRRAGIWYAELYDIDHARQQDRLHSEWWQRYTDKALTYAARQPLLHRAFGDILAGLAVEDDAPPPGSIPAAAPTETAEDGPQDPENPGDLHRGVSSA
jgi:hypothetical protein